jgi:hypothetical protein
MCPEQRVICFVVQSAACSLGVLLLTTMPGFGDFPRGCAAARLMTSREIFPSGFFSNRHWSEYASQLSKTGNQHMQNRLLLQDSQRLALPIPDSSLSLLLSPSCVLMTWTRWTLCFTICPLFFCSTGPEGIHLFPFFPSP